MWVFTHMHARCAHGRVLVLEPRLWPTDLVKRFLAARKGESGFVTRTLQPRTTTNAIPALASVGPISVAGD